MKRYHYQFLTEEQRRKAINATYFKRDSLVYVFGFIASLLALAGINYLYWNCEKVDKFIEMILR